MTFGDATHIPSFSTVPVPQFGADLTSVIDSDVVG